MRKPEYLSPSSLKKFYSDRQAFYNEYLCETKGIREPQTQPMSVGSAFDAYVKSFMVERLLGKLPEFEFQTIFEAQVEPHNRDWALAAGKYCFEQYTKLGALHDIFADLNGCVGKPRFEKDIKGYVQKGMKTIPLRGKPDLFFITKEGVRVVFDWKVNGYCSQASPKPGYIRIRSHGRTNGDMHKDCNLTYINKYKISGKFCLEHLDLDWAAQTAIYAWLLGEDIGSQFVSSIDQLACKSDKLFGGPVEIRVAQHRCLISSDFQNETFNQAVLAWEAIQSGHIFFEKSREESDMLCEQLELVAKAPVDPLFEQMMGMER